MFMKIIRKLKVFLNQVMCNCLFDEVVDDYVIYILDSVGCIVSWSVGVVCLFGYDVSEIFGCDYVCFYICKDCDVGVL